MQAYDIVKLSLGFYSMSWLGFPTLLLHLLSLIFFLTFGSQNTLQSPSECPQSGSTVPRASIAKYQPLPQYMIPSLFPSANSLLFIISLWMMPIFPHSCGSTASAPSCEQLAGPQGPDKTVAAPLSHRLD